MDIASPSFLHCCVFLFIAVVKGATLDAATKSAKIALKWP